MPIMGLLSDLEEAKQRQMLANMLATNPELRNRAQQERRLNVQAKQKSRLKLLKSQLMQNPELRSMLKYTTLKLEDV